LEIHETVYALDASTIDLCLALFPKAKFRKTKAAIKLHTLLDLRGSIPSLIAFTDGKVHDVNILDILLLEAGAIYVMDRGSLDFSRLYTIHQGHSSFVTSLKSNTQFERVYSHPVDKTTGVQCDQTIVLSGFYSKKAYPDKLRRIKFTDLEKQQRFDFLTNPFSLSSLIIVDLYRHRWKVELFFKWIDQHLRIKAFYGTSENPI
jgi:IS4 transposase